MARENAYNFVQSSASATWVITHNLGRRVIVDCFVMLEGQLQTILPNEVVHTDDNVTTISFMQPYSGTARCI